MVSIEPCPSEHGGSHDGGLTSVAVLPNCQRRMSPNSEGYPVMPKLPPPLPPRHHKACDRWGAYDSGRAVGMLCWICKDVWLLAYSYHTEPELLQQKASVAGFDDCFARSREAT